MFEATHQHHPGEHTNVPRSSTGSRQSPRDTDLQRAKGGGRIVLSGSRNGTRIADVYQKFPTRVMFPMIGDGAVKEAVIINSAGGIAGGDQIELEVIALADASVAVTSQAAEKVYRALDQPACVATKLKAYDAAKLAWLPQETIIFDQARIRRKTEVELCSGAELIALEWLVLGRAAHGEDVVSGYVADSWRVRRDGRLIWADGFHVADDVFAQLHRRALLANCKAVGTMIYFGPALDRRLQVLREIAATLACQCAATSVGALVIVRFAAEASADLRRGLRSLLEQFRHELGPGPFGVPKMWSC
ncbi:MULTISPECIES: urease accessory protein UreD [Bradyrhizobium]|uniref:urease accessory protein UreD n=1 Tax=Bradyrhizobium elkanii TaxID=29448 RepID=UPI0004829D03|nr:urease accessory protein UreD [Bradyrhizobium elkanii]